MTTGSDIVLFLQNWRGGVRQVRYPSKSGVRKVPCDSHLQFSQKQNVQHTEQEQGRNVNANNNIRNAPVGVTDAFSYFCWMEIFIMLQVQYAGSWPRHGICDPSCSLWDTSRKCFWKYLKVGVTDQTWFPASFLLMINPGFWSQQRLEAFPDLHLLFMLCSIS